MPKAATRVTAWAKDVGLGASASVVAMRGSSDAAKGLERAQERRCMQRMLIRDTNATNLISRLAVARRSRAVAAPNGRTPKSHPRSALSFHSVTIVMRREICMIAQLAWLAASLDLGHDEPRGRGRRCTVGAVGLRPSATRVRTRRSRTPSLLASLKLRARSVRRCFASRRGRHRSAAAGTASPTVWGEPIQARTSRG